MNGKYFASTLFCTTVALFGAANASDAAEFVRRDADPNNSFYDIIDDFQRFSGTEANVIDLETIGARIIEPPSLTLVADDDIEIFFINEGALYRNQLGVTATKDGVESSQILFEDITCTRNCAYNGYRDRHIAIGTPDNNPLEIGDYVALENVAAGTTLDFFIRSDGYQRDFAWTLHSTAERNHDGLQHAIAYEYQDYVVLAFEDIAGGGDRDYNDVIFALDVNSTNLANFSSQAVPEPKTIAGILVALTCGLGLRASKARKLG